MLIKEIEKEKSTMFYADVTDFVKKMLGDVVETAQVYLGERVDLEKLSDVATHFRGVANKMKAEGTLDPKVLNVDAKTLIYQVPGGMLSNTISQLKQAGKEDKL